MLRKSRSVFVIFTLSIVLLLSNVMSVVNLEELNDISQIDVRGPVNRKMLHAGIPHAPIVIDGDTNFVVTASIKGWSGNGSASDPYIIENLDIDKNGTIGHCINITNTRVHFIIRNCQLQGANQSTNSGAAVFLGNVSGGKIVDNNCTNNWYTIYLWNSHENIIRNNNCSNNLNRGIYLEGSSHHNTIESNTCNYNIYGVVLYGCDYNRVVNNTCNYNNGDGIHLNDANYNNMTFNDCINNGAWGIQFVTASFYNRVINNTCNTNSGGILVGSVSSFNRVLDNKCENNSAYGIRVYGSTGSQSNIVSNNILRNSTYGFYCYAAANTITKNILIDNGYGIYLWNSISNTLTWNAISNSITANGYETGGSSNTFDYNYWSDYTGPDANLDGIGETSYTFSGNSDPHPLIYNPTPPTWNETPINQTITDIELLYYDLNVTSHAPVFWTLNDTINFMIDGDGLLESTGILAIDTYGLNVEVTNIYGSSISITITIEVVPWDTTAPSWLTTPDNQVVEYGTTFRYDANATDPSSLDTWWLNRTDFSIDLDGIIVNTTNLSIQTYGLEISVNDTYGNVQSISIVITVEDTTSPIWIETPTDQIIEFGNIFAYDLEAYDYSGIHHYEINDTRYEIDGNGLIQNNTVLSVGEYWIDIRAYDQYYQYCSEIIVVSVHDTTAPIWITTPTDVIMDEGEQLEYELSSWDLSGVVHWEVNDTMNFGITSDGRIFNLHNLVPGVYGILVSAYDEYDNSIFATFTVYVRDLGLTSTATTTTTTSTTTTTTTTNTSTSVDEMDPLLVLGLGAGIGGAAVVVIVIVFLKRKS